MTSKPFGFDGSAGDAKPEWAVALPSAPATGTTARTTAGMQYDHRILQSLRRIIRSVELYSRQLAVNNRITAPQLVCLLAVVNQGQGPTTATVISRDVHLSASTVVGILDRLEEKGWISRVRARDDRRVVLVTATEEGVALARQAPSPLQRTLANALNALPELERATIALSLERVVSLMEAQVIDAPALVAAEPASPPAI